MYLTWKQDLTRWPSVFPFPLNYKRNGTWSQPKHLGRDRDYDVLIFSAKCKPHTCLYGHIEEQQNEPVPLWLIFHHNHLAGSQSTWKQWHIQTTGKAFPLDGQIPQWMAPYSTSLHRIISTKCQVRVSTSKVWCFFVVKYNMLECQRREIVLIMEGTTQK